MKHVTADNGRPTQAGAILVNDGLVHMAGYDGLVHFPDAIMAHAAGDFMAHPPGQVTIPTPPADQVLHVINEGVIGHIINEVV